MRRPEVKEMQTLARLTFNPAAMRQLFDESTKGVRLRIEHGVVGFRPSATLRGADVVAIERRPRRGAYMDIISGQDSKKLMTRLFRAGLTEEQPYFSLEPQARGWFVVGHIVEQPDPRQPLMVVSEFETPPPPVDLLVWRRFLRAITTGKTVEVALWTLIRRMIRGAVQMTAKPQRGRLSQARLDAESLVKAAGKNGLSLRTFAERQPEYDNDVMVLLTDLGIEDEAAEMPPRRRRGAEPEPPVEPELDTAITEIVTEVVVRPKRRRKAVPVYEPEPAPEELPVSASTNEVLERGIDRLLDEEEVPEDEAAEAADEEAIEGGADTVTGAQPETAEERQPESVGTEEFFITEVPPGDDLGPEDVLSIETIEDWGSQEGEGEATGAADETPEEEGIAENPESAVSVTGAEAQPEVAEPEAAASEDQADTGATEGDRDVTEGGESRETHPHDHPGTPHDQQEEE